MDEGSRNTIFTRYNYLSFLDLDLVKCTSFYRKVLGQFSLVLFNRVSLFSFILHWCNQLWYLCPTIRFMPPFMRELKASPPSPFFWNYTHLFNQTLYRGVCTCWRNSHPLFTYYFNTMKWLFLVYIEMLDLQMSMSILYYLYNLGMEGELFMFVWSPRWERSNSWNCHSPD